MKRRILCFVLTMAMVLSMLVVVPAATVTAESDTYDASANPVLITTLSDLKAFRNAVNGGNTFEGKVVKLCGDIDISDASWSPIAKNGYAFCGSFDGQGHTITGLYQSYGRFTGDGGLFGFVQVPTTGGEIYIKNLKLTKKGSEKMNSSSGGYCAGTLVSIIAPRSGVAGTVNIENVYSSVDFDSSGKLMTAFGGIVGTISGTTGQHDNDASYASGTSITLNIDSCQYAGNAGSPSAGSTWYGGIMGCNNFVQCNQTVSITNCLVTGEMHIWGSGGLGNYDDNGGILGYVKGNGGASGCKTTISLCNNIFAGTMIWRNDSGQTGGTADQGYILGEITSGYLNSATLTNNYYVVSAPQGGLTVTAGLGAGSQYATITNLTEKTLDQVKALTSSDFTDGSKWHFESGKVPQPASIYETFFEGVAASIFDDMTQSEFVITNDSQMAEFQAKVNGGTTFAGKTIKLGADVNLNGRIGATSSLAFSGNFDGQGHTVTITQSITNPDGNGGLFDFVRIPANGTVTIKDVHVTGTITLTNNNYGYGYTGGLISAVDANTSGNGGTINIQNVWNTVRINCGNSNAWNYVGGFIGFVRHADGLKQITINIDSCLWDGVLNSGPAIYGFGGFVAYTGNNKADRQPTINITNSVLAGKFSANIDGWNQQFGVLTGFLKGSYNDAATAKLTVNVENVISVATATFAKPTGSGSEIGLIQKVDGTTELNLSNIYYKTFARPGVEGDFPVVANGSAATSTNVEEKTQAELLTMSTSVFSDSSKWIDQSDEHYPCPAGIVNVFGSVPDTLYVEGTDINIGTDAAMANFAAAVSGGKTYAGKNVHLTADVNLTTTIGATSSYPFSGNFNGHGHTVTISQTFADPDGNGGLFSFVRVPENSTVTIENVHLAGTITLTNSSTGKGYVGALISCVDAGTSGSGGTLNVTNVWSTTRINAGNSNTWYALSGYIGFVRHASGLKPITINMDSCLWDGVINAGPALEYSGSFIGYTGNQSGANRPLNLNITNSAVAGKIMLNTAYTDDSGLLAGYLKGNGSNSSTSVITANFHDIAITGRITSSTNLTKWCSLFQVSGTDVVDMDNFYYISFDVPGKGAIPVYEGTATVTGSATEVTAAEMYNLPTSAFSDASKWTKQTGYNPCPAGIVTAFGAIPESLEVDPTEFITEIEIGSVAEFLAFRDAVNAGTTYSGKTILLTTDIDLTGEDWVGIGSRNTGDTVFSGTFDGQGHTISNLTVAAATTETGALFGQAGNATIQNFTLTGSITIGTDSETDFLGSVINCVYGNTTLRNVRSLVNFTPAANGKKLYYAGGLVGFIHNSKSTDLTIDNCEYAGNINTGGYTNSISGILGYTGWGNSGVTKTVTITNTLFTGSINFNDNGYYHNNGGFIGYVKRANNGGTITINISNSYSAGRLYFRRAAAWTKENCDQCGQIIGLVDAGVTLNIASTVVYKEAYLYTQVENEKPVESSKVVLGEIGLIEPDSYAYDTPAEVASMDVSFSKRDVDDQYKGVRFSATFTNVGACQGGGTASANFGIFLMTRETYEILGGAAVTISQLVGNNSVVQVKATKYVDNKSSYVVNAVVFNLNTATRQATELVAIPYAGSDLGTAEGTTYNAVFN